MKSTQQAKTPSQSAEKTGKPILDALVNASESFAEPNQQTGHTPDSLGEYRSVKLHEALICEEQLLRAAKAFLFEYDHDCEPKKLLNLKFNLYDAIARTEGRQ
jgi:hypothetical protein